MNELERQQRRELRGSLLRTARLVYGDGGRVSIDSFLHVVGRRFTRRAVEEELRYLTDVGYLVRHSNPRDALDEDPPVDYSLAAPGMQVLNGDKADPSIDL